MFLDERGRRGLLVRGLGALGALGSAGALMLLVIGALAFGHISPVSVHRLLAARPAVAGQSGRAAADRDPPGSYSRDVRNENHRPELVAGDKGLQATRARA